MSQKVQSTIGQSERAADARDTAGSTGRRIKTAIWGCGAVAEYYYASALNSLSNMFSVVALHDPNAERTTCLQRSFPDASIIQTISELPSDLELVIICSPPRFHAEQSVEALNRGFNILCEKPVAASSAEVASMIDTASASSRLAAAGLFRRFFPSSAAVKKLLDVEALGALQSFHVEEGEQFQWQSRSASPFDRSTASGGVLSDIGSHILDLLSWWLGELELKSYCDDYMGGVEANAAIELRTKDSVPGTVRISRDCRLANRYSFRCSNGTITWIVGKANGLELTLPDGQILAGDLLESWEPLSGIKLIESDYFECFKNQLLNVGQSILGQTSLMIPVSCAVQGVKLIETCYGQRQLIPMGWLTDKENAAALRLNQERPAS